MRTLTTIQIILSLIFLAGCSTEKKEQSNSTTKIPNPMKKQLAQTKPLKSTDFDPCDCNKRSQKILDKTITFRLKFDSIAELKSNQSSKTQIRKFATEYIELTQKCFEINHAQLMVDSECNNLKILAMKKDSLNALGVPIQQGAAIKL